MLIFIPLKKQLRVCSNRIYSIGNRAALSKFCTISVNCITSTTVQWTDSVPHGVSQCFHTLHVCVLVVFLAFPILYLPFLFYPNYLVPGIGDTWIWIESRIFAQVHYLNWLKLPSAMIPISVTDQIVFSVQSKVFNKMFLHNLEEKKTNRVTIPDIKAAIFEVFSKFLYTGKVNSLSEFDEELLIVAEKVCCCFYLRYTQLSLTTLHSAKHRCTICEIA